MILGIGVDAVCVNRFSQWNSYSIRMIATLFSSQEIEYCKKNSVLSAQRFSVRFAAKEALFKALQDKTIFKKLSFRELCKCTEIAHNSNHAPFFIVQWSKILNDPQSTAPYVHVSLTHTDSLAIAYVVVSSP